MRADKYGEFKENMQKPKKWYDVYPYGTKEGNEEALVFIFLCRKNKYDWGSTASIVKSTGLTRQRVEEIIDKYVSKTDPPLIYPHPTNEEHWGYWERVPEVLQKDNRSITQKDHDKRIDKQLSGNSVVGVTSPSPAVSLSVCDTTVFNDRTSMTICAAATITTNTASVCPYTGYTIYAVKL